MDEEVEGGEGRGSGGRGGTYLGDRRRIGMRTVDANGMARAPPTASMR